MNVSERKFDLEERTAKFAENVIDFCKVLKVNYLNENIVKQLLKSLTSVGANYQEANACNSKRF
jgi:four helix bundle protein